MHTDQNTLSSYLLFLIPFYVAGMWLLISTMVSFIGGWRTLSRRFRAQHAPEGNITTAGPFTYSVYMRFRTHYGNVIRVTSAQDGLYLSVLAIFRVAHPPLFIPWHEIELTRSSFLWWRYVVLTLGREEQIPMRISERMARDARVFEHTSSMVCSG